MKKFIIVALLGLLMVSCMPDHRVTIKESFTDYNELIAGKQYSILIVDCNMSSLKIIEDNERIKKLYPEALMIKRERSQYLVLIKKE